MANYPNPYDPFEQPFLHAWERDRFRREAIANQQQSKQPLTEDDKAAAVEEAERIVRDHAQKHRPS